MTTTKATTKATTTDTNNALTRAGTHASSLRGFSLIELLIAMTLGLILIAGMITVFSGNRRSSELNGEMANMQENARFAVNAMSRDIRMAGYQGCPDINSASAGIVAKNAPSNNIFLSATSGSEVITDDTWSPPPPPSFEIPDTTPPVPGTHALVLQFGGPDSDDLWSEMADENAAVVINPDPLSSNFQADVGDLMLISNCMAADVFRITQRTQAGSTVTLDHAATATGNWVGSLTMPYEVSSKVMRFNSEVYFVGDTGLTNNNGDAITALYRQSLPYTEPPTELVQGVENMRLRFGVRTPTGTMRFFRPNDPGLETGEVQSIQIGLLMNSYDQIAAADDEQTYTLAGQAIPPTDSNVTGDNHAKDRRYRLVFNTTVQVRNRR